MKNIVNKNKIVQFIIITCVFYNILYSTSKYSI